MILEKIKTSIVQVRLRESSFNMTGGGDDDIGGGGAPKIVRHPKGEL